MKKSETFQTKLSRHGSKTKVKPIQVGNVLFTDHYSNYIDTESLTDDLLKAKMEINELRKQK